MATDLGIALAGSAESVAAARSDFDPTNVSSVEKSKVQRINGLHVKEMLRSLHATASIDIADLDRTIQHFQTWAPIFPAAFSEKVFTYDEVHRIALTALGLLLTSPIAAQTTTEGFEPQLNWAHVALAMGMLRASDVSKHRYFVGVERLQNVTAFATPNNAKAASEDNAEKQRSEQSLHHQRILARVAATASKHEKRLMPGIADAEQIKTTFDQVHVPKETIDALRTITSLSLLRPDSFSYGILATEKISGALLYGPPGTGKTLLAKAVAKESGCTVLEVSGSQIMDKYVGEGEKNVAAVFSLARKLSPCIVFLDEADAVFASRDAMRDRSSHRDILNQFLKEWDGLNDLSVFVMVATNRPFDLDDAVIRRLPRRLLVDLPTQLDRKEILRIHLKGEQLDDAVDLEDLAKRTPFYSGSDLKNVAVSAALACVKEENEAAAAQTPTNEARAAVEATQAASPDSSSHQAEVTSSDAVPNNLKASGPSTPSTSSRPPHLVRGRSYNFPEKRILRPSHFNTALQEISASISEDMSSLSAIKKFDEQYGDRKGNKRRKDFGFGMLAERNENAARVRI